LQLTEDCKSQDWYFIGVLQPDPIKGLLFSEVANSYTVSTLFRDMVTLTQGELFSEDLFDLPLTFLNLSTANVR